MSYSNVSTKTKTTGLAFTIDAIPYQVNQGTQVSRFYQDFLSSLTLVNTDQATSVQSNQQNIIVPTPDLCRNPAGQLASTSSDFYEASYCYFSDGFWPSWGSQKNRMACIRSWMMGYQRDRYSNSDVASGCGVNPQAYFSGSYYQNTTIYNNPNVLMHQIVKSGPFAGTEITVKLMNLRSLYDSGISIQDNSSSMDNGGAYPSEVNGTRWRTRYQIEINNIPTTSVRIQANWGWTSQQRVLLGASTGVQPIPGSLNSTKATAVSVYGYGDKTYGDADAKQLTWKTICVDGLRAGNGGTGCGYVWQDQDGYNDMPVGFTVKNGFTNPIVQYSLNRTAHSPELNEYSFANNGVRTTNPVTNQVDGNSYISLPDVQWSDPCTSSVCYKQVIFREYVPLYVNATSIDVPLKYYSDTTGGTDLQGQFTTTSGDPFRNLVVNTENDPLKTITTSVPVSPRQGEVFSHWKLVGVKNGNVLGTIGKDCSGTTCSTVYDQLRPGSTLDLTDPRFADGSLAGKAAITDGTGTQVVDELRLVPVFTDMSSTDSPQYFVAKKILRSSTDTEVGSFSYAALPDMKAEFTDAYKTANTTYTVADTGISYDRRDAVSTLSIDPLVDGRTSVLSMVYVVPQPSKVSVTKTVDKALYDSMYAQRNNMPLTSDFSWAAGTGGGPTATDFKVRLTDTTDQSKTYDIVTHQSGATSLNTTQQVQVPAGTYQVTEPQVWNSSTRTWVINKVWTVKRTAGSFECYASDDTNHTNNLLDKTTGQMTLTTDQTIDCSFTNAAAAVALLTFNGATGQYVPNTTGGQDRNYLFNFIGADASTSSNGWPAKGKVTVSMGWIASDAKYALTAMQVPAGMTLVGFQRYNPGSSDVSQFLSAEKDADATHWVAADPSNPSVSSTFTGGNNLSTGTDDQNRPAINISVPANQFNVYRAVVVPTSQLTTLEFKAGLQTSNINWAGAKRIGTSAQNLPVDQLSTGRQPTDAQISAYVNNYALEIVSANAPANGTGAGVVTNGNTNLDDRAGQTYQPIGTSTNQTVTANPPLDGATAASGTSSPGKFYLLRGSATDGTVKRYTLKELFKGATVATGTSIPDVTGYGVNTNFGLSSLTCTPTADDGTILGDQALTLTATNASQPDASLVVPSTWSSVSCTAYNGIAQLGFMIYNDTTKSYTISTDPFKFDIARNDPTAIDAGNGWPGKGTSVGVNSSQVSPMVPYTIRTNTSTASIPLGYVVQSCQVWIDGYDSNGDPIYHNFVGTSPDSNSKWYTIPCDNVTVPAGYYYVVRAVVQQGVPIMLPATGRPADYFIIGGLAALGLAGALVPMMRRGKFNIKLPFLSSAK